MIELTAGPLTRIAVLGAHCDDIAIGVGGTLLALCERSPGVRIDAYVASGGGTPREAEERAALARFCPGADLHVTIDDLPDGFLPGCAQEVKLAVRELAARGPAELVLAPQPADAHQDHRVLAQVAPTEFRNNLVLGYEILKWESDLPQANAYHELGAEILTRKIALLHRCYPSQAARSWFDEEAFRGLARVRGVQAGVRYAEAFVLGKAVLSLGG